MRSEIECRANQSAVECRSGGQRRIGGLAAVFGVPSQELPGGFIEIVDPQAFSASRETKYRGVIATYEHRDLLASVKGNTLWLEITPRGLDYTAELVTSRSDVYELCQRGDLFSSFAFIVSPGGDSWSHRDGHPVRTLNSVALRDVSAVSSPAYLQADVALRSLARLRASAAGRCGPLRPNRFAVKVLHPHRPPAGSRRVRQASDANADAQTADGHTLLAGTVDTDADSQTADGHALFAGAG